LKLEFLTVDGLPVFKEGDDLGRLLSDRFAFRENDVLLVASTVVSKSEGRVARLAGVEPSQKAMEMAARRDDDPRFVELVLRESDDVVQMNGLLLARTRFGHVGPNAGLDRSNTEDGTVLLLPVEPDASARRISDGIFDEQRLRVGVIVTDTCGRPFRQGQTGVAVGVWGMPRMKDWRGQKDMYGRELDVTCEAIADELAAAANVLMGEGGGGIPAVVCRGLVIDENSNGRSGCDGLYRPEEEDMVYHVLKKHYSGSKNH